MSLRDAVVITQMCTNLVLAYLFFKAGLWQWAVAQGCYGVATFVIFISAAQGG